MKKKKTSLKKELLDLKTKIDKLKENIQKLIGEEKYKYIIEISSIGIKDDSMQEEVKIKIESFIKDIVLILMKMKCMKFYIFLFLNANIIKNNNNLINYCNKMKILLFLYIINKKYNE